MRKVVASLLGLILVIATVFTGRWFVAELYVIQVNNQLAAWAEAQEVSSLDEWNATLAQLEKAFSLKPAQAEYYSTKGLIYEWRIYVLNDEGLRLETENADTIERIGSEALEQAIAAYRQSVELRPSWPYGWMHLAQQKALLGQQDEELSFALMNALRLGTNEPDIQEMAIEVIILAWPFFSENSEINRLLSAP